MDEHQVEERKWWAGTGLNRRHQDFQSCALPTELPAHHGLVRVPKARRSVQERGAPGIIEEHDDRPGAPAIPGARGVRGQRRGERDGLRPRGGRATPTDPLTRAVRLYYAVRDEIVYTPYCDFTDVETFRASACLSRGAGFCVAKAVAPHRGRAGRRHPGADRLRGRAQPSLHAAAARADGHRHLRLPRLHGSLPGRPLGQGHAGLRPRALREVRGAGARVRRPRGFALPALRRGRAGATWSICAIAGARADVPVAEIMAAFARALPGPHRAAGGAVGDPVQGGSAAVSLRPCPSPCPLPRGERENGGEGISWGRRGRRRYPTRRRSRSFSSTVKASWSTKGTSCWTRKRVSLATATGWDVEVEGQRDIADLVHGEDGPVADDEGLHLLLEGHPALELRASPPRARAAR